jgi:hypothetical protein
MISKVLPVNLRYQLRKCMAVNLENCTAAHWLRVVGGKHHQSSLQRSSSTVVSSWSAMMRHSIYCTYTAYYRVLKRKEKTRQWRIMFIEVGYVRSSSWKRTFFYILICWMNWDRISTVGEIILGLTKKDCVNLLSLVTQLLEKRDICTRTVTFLHERWVATLGVLAAGRTIVFFKYCGV